MRVAANTMHQSLTAWTQSNTRAALGRVVGVDAGQSVTTIAFPVLVLHSREFVGLVAFAATAPSILVHTPAVRSVDCRDPLWIMLASEFGRGIAVGVLVMPLVVHEECRPLLTLAMSVQGRNQQVFSTRIEQTGALALVMRSREMPETLRRTARAAAWSVLAAILGAAAVAAWSSTSRSESRAWLAWMLSMLTAAAVYLCFADPLGLWPTRRRRGVTLVFEIVGNCLRLGLFNRGPAAEFFAQVTSVCQPPTGRPKGLQHWPIPWLDDHTAEPKRILNGQTRTLDFAVFDPTAVNTSLSTGQDSADHWKFASVPEAIGVKYYNLLSPTDVEDQEFILTIRIMNADSEDYLDWQITVKVKDIKVVCELTPIKRSRFFPARRQAAPSANWSGGPNYHYGDRSLLITLLTCSVVDLFGGAGGMRRATRG